ncbi:MAG: SPOR domain-containing protein [Spirochaetales bacterium]|nr:SPOR domain-containing protein [Spirochaetales bacterium]
MRIILFISIYLVIILFPCFYCFSQNQTLEEAKKTEKENKIIDALNIYKTWLKENSGHEEFINTLQHVIHLESNGKDLLHFLYEIDSISKTQNEKIFIAETIAQLEEFYGNFSRANEYYLYAYNNGTGDKRYLSLLSATQLLYKQGILDKSKEYLEIILEFIKDAEILVRAGILLSSVHIAMGDWDKARDNYILLIKHYKSTTMYPALLLGYLECLHIYGYEEEINKILEVFKEYYPSSPEYSLALLCAGINEEGSVSYYPSPSSFMNNSSNNEDFDEPVKMDDKSVIVYIQTGSFVTLENAEDMVKELKKNNIKAIIREKKVNNTNYYCVLIESESSKPEIINEYILKLKEAGFEGFLVTE